MEHAYRACGNANPPGKKFCGDCGTALKNRCARCGADNPRDKKFCGDCGASLASRPLPSDPTTNDLSPRSYAPRHLADKILTSRSALEGERKQVTVLFADVKGSMELAEQMDPEEPRTLPSPRPAGDRGPGGGARPQYSVPADAELHRCLAPRDRRAPQRCPAPGWARVRVQ